MKNKLRFAFLLAFAVLVSFVPLTGAIVYNIKGYALKFSDGLPVAEGNISAIVKETGEINSTNISNGYFDFNLSSQLDYRQNRFSVGIFANSTDNKSGYFLLEAGSGNPASQTQTCARKTWRFTGYAIDLVTGKTVSGGKVTVNLDEVTDTNATSIVNGYYDLQLTPCLLSGKLYTFNLLVNSNQGNSYLSLRQVAK